MDRRQHRRDFLKTAAAGVGFWVAGGSAVQARTRSANEKLNIGIIGAGGRGASNTASVAGENIVALCDVAANNLDQAAQRYPKARKYADFRRLLEQSKDLDAVVVSTTEHTHSFAVLPAIQLGKHVYCEKPVCHSIWETRQVIEATKKSKAATQMGTQIHAGDNYRRVVELVQTGAIGSIEECHVWVSRGGAFWGGGGRPRESKPVPAHLNWDLWLGPAPYRPFHDVYVPGPKWYKWWDFGGGVLPDLGSHWNDLPFWALNLGQPLTAEAEGPPVNPETAPPWMIVRWEFPGRGSLPPVKLTWYQGDRRPKLVSEGKVPAWGDGILFVGSRGLILADYGRHLLLPEAQFAGFQRPKAFLPPSIGHHAEWLAACKTGSPTTCHFGYSGVLTEANLLGNVAYRVGKKLEWDPVNLRAKNCPEAERLIRPQFRKGWSL